MSRSYGGRAQERSEAAPGETAEAAAARSSYHHGALRAALVAATEAILAERGVEAFSLREAARRAGVSPAAPAHHFGDAAGLLTEVAILGFEELARRLREGSTQGGADPAARLCGQGMAYVGFALAYPARFQLMFRSDKLRREDERLRTAGRAAFMALEDAVRDLAGLGVDEPLDRAAFALLLRAWSAVHGFAHLALDGAFARFAAESGGLEAFVADALPGVLAPIASSLQTPKTGIL